MNCSQYDGKLIIRQQLIERIQISCLLTCLPLYMVYLSVFHLLIIFLNLKPQIIHENVIM